MEITYENWIEESKKRYKTPEEIAFRCPVCGYVATVREWREVGANDGEIGFSCIGRRMDTKREAFGSPDKRGPCNYAGGGLIGLNPVDVIFDDGNTASYFDFADDPLCGDS